MKIVSVWKKIALTNLVFKLNQFSGQMWKMEGTNGSKLMNRAGMFDSNDTWILIRLHQEVAKGNSHYYHKL